METKCYGTCMWHEWEMDDRWICFNVDSAYCADRTNYYDFRKEWEERA